jgi:hypothetical protein
VAMPRPVQPPAVPAVRRARTWRPADLAAGTACLMCRAKAWAWLGLVPASEIRHLVRAVQPLRSLASAPSRRGHGVSW